jgi:hypothetical protein
MKAIIQHNFLTGMGDCIQFIYEYLDVAVDLKKLGYEIKLLINDSNNMYFEKNKFFDFFNKSEFEKYFDEIEFTELTGHYMNIDNCDQIYHSGNVTPYGFLWGVFVELGHTKEISDKTLLTIKDYSYLKPLNTDYKNIINENLIKKYQEFKNKLNLTTPYKCLYFRSHDLEDNEDTYPTYEKEMLNFLNCDESVFVCSNSYGFKKYIKSKNLNNVVITEIPGEITNGNQINLDYSFFDNIEVLLKRTEYVIFEMLLLAESKEIEIYTLWNRISNFIFFCKLKKVKMNFKTLNIILN